MTDPKKKLLDAIVAIDSNQTKDLVALTESLINNPDDYILVKKSDLSRVIAENTPGLSDEVKTLTDEMIAEAFDDSPYLISRLEVYVAGAEFARKFYERK